MRDKYKCEKQCWFLEPEITTENIDKWPSSCYGVCGLIVLNQNSDVSVEVLSKKFERLYSLSGGFIIENSSYTSLPSFGEGFYLGQCNFVDVSIKNNSELVNITSLSEFKYDKCSMTISNNSKLSNYALCNSRIFYSNTNWFFTGNKQDCCPSQKITPKSLEKFYKSYGECNDFSGEFVISGFGNEPPNLSNVKKINGALDATKTSFTNLSFLSNLETIIDSFHIGINVYNNPNMTRFGISSLKNLSNPDNGFSIFFKRLHPDFCLTIEEMTLFLDSDAVFLNIDAKYCSQNMTRRNDARKLCIFEDMEKLENGCDHVFGDIWVLAGDEEYVYKLESVTYIFGSISIEGTSLENADFLKKLKRVANLNETFPNALMQFISNKNLRGLKLPNIKKCVSRKLKMNYIILEDNHPDIFEDIRFCLIIHFRAGTSVFVDGKSCIDVKLELPKNETGFELTYEDYVYRSGTDWYYDSDDDEFSKTKLTIFDKYFDILKKLSIPAIFIGLVGNCLHLIILLQGGLRGISIFALLIVISLFDIVMLFGFALEHYLDGIWMLENPCSTDSYQVAVFKLYNPKIRETFRMSLLITGFVMSVTWNFSMSPKRKKQGFKTSKPFYLVLLMFGTLLVSGFYNFGKLTFLECRVLTVDLEDCFIIDKSHHTYYPHCGPLSDADIGLVPVFSTIDGSLVILLAFSQFISLIFIKYNLRFTQKSTTSEDEDAEEISELMTFYAYTFLVSEICQGTIFIVDLVFWGNSKTMKTFNQKLDVLPWTILIFCATFRWLACCFYSSQYFNGIKNMFFKKSILK